MKSDKDGRRRFGESVEDYVISHFFEDGATRSAGADLSKFDIAGVMPGRGFVFLEVKASPEYSDTNFFMKFQSYGESGWYASGIQVTQAGAYLVYKGRSFSAYLIPVPCLRLAYDEAVAGGYEIKRSSQRGTNATPDRGYLVDIAPFRAPYYDSEELSEIFSSTS